MNPLSLAAALVSPAMHGATKVAAGGADFLQALLAPELRSPEAGQPVVEPTATTALSPDPAIAELQRLIADELRRAGYGDSLPLEIADDGFGEIRITSDTPDRRAIEEVLSAHPAIARQFRSLAPRDFAAPALRITIPA